MPSGDSVTRWLGPLKDGEAEAARHLWERYFTRLARVARLRLRGARRRMADEEDVALSALDSFCRAAVGGRFPDLRDRHGLWPLLVAITARKAGKLVRHERAAKRGGGRVRGDSALAGPADFGEGVAGWEQVLGAEPSPAFAAQVAEQIDCLLERLGDPSLRTVALRKMEGYTNEEIKLELGCSLATVERKLSLIRKALEKEATRE
jgi:DNA-directed RNA polymerase specialized sigma24 family protein